jgi:hypothetical protein
MTYVSRDPFARTELHRERVLGAGNCSWCGQIRRTKGGTKYLYQYRTESDGGRKSEHGGLFCSKPCHDDYHSL